MLTKQEEYLIERAVLIRKEVVGAPLEIRILKHFFISSLTLIIAFPMRNLTQVENLSFLQGLEIKAIRAKF